MNVRRGPWPGTGHTSNAVTDVERFQQIYAAYYARIVGYAVRRASNREEAADVVAETFLIAWRNLAKVPEGDAAKLWLYGTARRVLANMRRGQHRRERLTARIAFELDVRPFPTLEVESGLVGEAIRRLPEADRNLLGLIAWEGLSHAEISGVLGCSVGAVRIRAFRARRRLARELELLGYDENHGTDPEGDDR